KQNVLQSMSRKGNCLDNSPVESQIGLMKKEFQEKRTYPDRVSEQVPKNRLNIMSNFIVAHHNPNNPF
ncbi:hypothetical protein DKP75_07130, partial [Fructilactobacillus sanfranciscensis]